MLVQHHTKYQELHGEDEVVMMEKGEHRRLHNRLRRENKCLVPPADLAKISAAARKRSDICKAHESAYYKSDKGKRTKKQYLIRNVQQFMFSERLAPHVRLFELFRYNNKTGNFTYRSTIEGQDGLKLPVKVVK